VQSNVICWLFAYLQWGIIQTALSYPTQGLFIGVPIGIIIIVVISVVFYVVIAARAR
jgi:hypothetical protein